MTSKARSALIRALMTAAALSAGTASYAQGDSRLSDPLQLPETKGIVKQYTLTPHGDVDGLILTDGTEVKLPPHLTGQIVFAVKPGDAVSVRGLRARDLPLVDAASVTNFVSGITVTDNGPLRGPGAGIETRLSGKIAAPLHGRRGEVDGALLENGTVLRMPPPEAERMQVLLQPGQTIALRGTILVTPLGALVDVHAIGSSADQLTQLGAPPPPRGGPDGEHAGRRTLPPGRGPDQASPPPPREPRG
jgi:hypothetical protein